MLNIILKKCFLLPKVETEIGVLDVVDTDSSRTA